MLFRESNFLLIGEVQTPRELSGPDHNALGARRNRERVVLHVFTRTTEDGVKQFFFGRQFTLALGRNLADQDVARANSGTNANDAVFIEVGKGFFGDVGNIASELLSAELGLPNLHIKIFDVNGGEGVVLHKLLGDHDCVFEVVTVKRVEGDQNVLAQTQLTLHGGGTVGDDLSLFHALAQLHNGLLRVAGTFVQATEFQQLVLIGVVDNNALGINEGDFSGVGSTNGHSRVDTGRFLHTSGNPRHFRLEQWHGLTLHVRTHEGPVGIVMLQERNHGGRNADNLLGRDVDVVDLVGVHLHELALVAGQNRSAFDLSFGVQGFGGNQR